MVTSVSFKNKLQNLCNLPSNLPPQHRGAYAPFTSLNLAVLCGTRCSQSLAMILHCGCKLHVKNYQGDLALSI